MPVAAALGCAPSCTGALPAFVAPGHTPGIAPAGTIGAALGPRVLRW